jgi:MFS family permease
MRPLTLLSASALVFGVLPMAGRLGTVLGAVAAVLFGVILALAASYSPSALTVASGALGAFLSGVLGNQIPALAGALLLGLCFAERTLRVRERNSRIVHVILALGAGGLAGYLTSHYSGSDLWVRSVVVIVAAVLALAPLMIAADDPLAHALDDLASLVDAPAKDKLVAGAELRRSVDESLLDAASAKQAHRAWKSLLRLGQARVRLAGVRSTDERAQAVVRRVDQRLAEHVDSLTRMYTAADTASAVKLSIDDSALRNVESAGETLDEVSKAIMEEVA